MASTRVIVALLGITAWNIGMVHSAACYSGYSWAGWTACSESCGGGYRSRHCYRDGTIDTEPCNDICYWGAPYYANQCHCPPGTIGRCCEDIIECLSLPCKNGGTCNEHLNSFSCTCPPGTTGVLCDDILDCDRNPCKNGGTCHEYINYYTCDCVQGTTGQDCDDILECASNPCQNGGTCLEHVGGYTCNCPAGTTGTNCDDIPECISNPCQHGGTCNEMINMYKCTCPEAYTGVNCQHYLLSFNEEICRPHGACYFVFELSLTWDEAKNFCEARKGHLAVPDDMAEELYIESYLHSIRDRFITPFVWIGGTKTNAEAPKWIDGRVATLNRWPLGAPYDIPGSQCLVMDSSFNYEWQARPCDTSAFFICEETTPFVVPAIVDPPIDG